MKKISTQFHADFNEIVDFIKSVSRDLGLGIVLMNLKPFNMKLLNGSESIDEILSLVDIDSSKVRIVMKKGEIDLTAKSPNNFMDLNPGSIVINIGNFTTTSVCESAFLFMSDDEDAINIAKKAATKLKKITKAGAIVVNPNTGEKAKIRDHRYTKGAKKKYDEGVKMLTITGHFLNFFD